MSAPPPRPPRPIWLTLPSIAFNAFGLVLLPFLVGISTSLFFDVAQVADTLPALLGVSAALLFPVLLLQLVGTVAKSRRELAWWHQRRQLTLSRTADVVATHLGVVTPRGWALLVGALIITAMSLAMRFADFGIMAAFGLFLFYGAVAITLFVSTFLVGTLERRLGRAESGILRQVLPAVSTTGEAVDEVITARRVPVPWGYVLLIDDENPYRLRTASRFALFNGLGEIELRGRLKETPRGHFTLGPARIWYQDIFGITRISVASMGVCELKILPRIRPIHIIDPPRTSTSSPDVVTRPHRLATEDLFRFREYANGDDTRRIQWRLSMKSGRIQVRQPETREESVRSILLVLDTYVPANLVPSAAAGADDILDMVVDAYLGITQELVSRGDSLELVAAVSGDNPSEIVLERMAGRRGMALRWRDLGARVRWQSKYDLPAMLENLPDGTHAVVVTARFTSAPPGPLPGKSIAWLYVDPAIALGKQPYPWVLQVLDIEKGPLAFLLRLFRLPHPLGSSDNALTSRVRRVWQIRMLSVARARLRAAAKRRAGSTPAELSRRGDAVYLIAITPASVSLIGEHAQQRSASTPRAAHG